MPMHGNENLFTTETGGFAFFRGNFVVFLTERGDFQTVRQSNLQGMSIQGLYWVGM